MKTRKLDHETLARNLGSTVRGRVAAGAGYFGALQVAEEVRRRFTKPAGGGRARDPRWTTKRLMPVRAETLARLEVLAREVSRLVQHRVEPLQVAAVLVERHLAHMNARMLAQAIASAGPDMPPEPKPRA
jgi:hypothetical protein